MGCDEWIMLQVCDVNTSHRWPKWLRWRIIQWKFQKMLDSQK